MSKHCIRRNRVETKRNIDIFCRHNCMKIITKNKTNEAANSTKVTLSCHTDTHARRARTHKKNYLIVVSSARLCFASFFAQKRPASYQ